MRRRHTAIFALLFAGAGLAAGAASAQSGSGLYLSLEVGLNVAPSVELLGKSTDRASRCDEFINPLYAGVAGCTDPNRGSSSGWKTDYDSAMGILAGAPSDTGSGEGCASKRNGSTVHPGTTRRHP